MWRGAGGVESGAMQGQLRAAREESATRLEKLQSEVALLKTQLLGQRTDGERARQAVSKLEEEVRASSSSGTHCTHPHDMRE